MTQLKRSKPPVALKPFRQRCRNVSESAGEGGLKASIAADYPIQFLTLLNKITKRINKTHLFLWREISCREFVSHPLDCQDICNASADCGSVPERLLLRENLDAKQKANKRNAALEESPAFHCLRSCLSDQYSGLNKEATIISMLHPTVNASKNADTHHATQPQ